MLRMLTSTDTCQPYNRDRSHPQWDRLRCQEDELVPEPVEKLLKYPADHSGELSGVRHELENRIIDLYKALLLYQIKSVYS